jgi:hypothetical protein
VPDLYAGATLVSLDVRFVSLDLRYMADNTSSPVADGAQPSAKLRQAAGFEAQLVSTGATLKLRQRQDGIWLQVNSVAAECASCACFSRP